MFRGRKPEYQLCMLELHFWFRWICLRGGEREVKRKNLQKDLQWDLKMSHLEECVCLRECGGECTIYVWDRERRQGEVHFCLIPSFFSDRFFVFLFISWTVFGEAFPSPSFVCCSTLVSTTITITVALLAFFLSSVHCSTFSLFNFERYDVS